MNPKINSNPYVIPQGGAPGEFAGEPVLGTNCCCSRNDGTEFLTYDETRDLEFLHTALVGVANFFDDNDVDGITIDKTRIYMAGHSNGCVASMAMAAQASDLVAAVCCHAGSLFTQFAEDYTPVPVW